MTKALGNMMYNLGVNVIVNFPLTCVTSETASIINVIFSYQDERLEDSF